MSDNTTAPMTRFGLPPINGTTFVLSSLSCWQAEQLYRSCNQYCNLTISLLISSSSSKVSNLHHQTLIFRLCCCVHNLYFRALASDMQLHCVLPLFVLLWYKWPRVGLTVCVFAFAILSFTFDFAVRYSKLVCINGEQTA